MSKIKTYKPQTIVNARALRKNQTPQESTLWYYLRSKRFQGFKFRRQFPVGPYIVDLCCFKEKLIIELDGGQHSESDSLTYDAARDSFLRSEGYRVLRVWNNEVTNNLEGVLEKVYRMLVSGEDV